jgi:sensor domain CHASE-containing protein
MSVCPCICVFVSLCVFRSECVTGSCLCSHACPSKLFFFNRLQVRISELKEIVSYRAGPAAASSQPSVSQSNNMHRGGAVTANSVPVSSASDTVAAASPPAAAPAVDRRQLRSAVNNLSVFIENIDDNASPASSPIHSSQSGTPTASHTSRVSAATREVIQALASEDGSRCTHAPCC